VLKRTYKSKRSHPFNSHYYFAYRITIKNISDYTVQLKKRHWYIFDSNGIKSEVAGDGVIEVQMLNEANSLQVFLCT